MTETKRLPLFVQVPFHASLNDWFVSMKKSDLYSVNAFKFDSEIFPLLLSAKPCLILTSILDEASKTACLRFLHEFKQYRLSQGYPARDPALRIVVVAKNRQAASTNWPELGVYELMIAPVPTNVLTYKLSRHHQKALSAENQKGNLKLIEENKMTQIFRSEDQVKEPEWKVFQVPSTESSSPEVRRIEPTMSGRPEQKIQKIEIEAKLPDLQPGEGEWVSNDPNEIMDKKWEWKPSVTSSPSERTPPRATFYGEKPVYQPSRQAWQFSGEKPRLTELDPKAGPPPRELFKTLLEINHKPSVQARPTIEIQSAKQKVYLELPNEEPRESSSSESSSRQSSVADEKRSSGFQPSLPEIEPLPKQMPLSSARTESHASPKEQSHSSRSEKERAAPDLGKTLPPLEVNPSRPLVPSSEVSSTDSARPSDETHSLPSMRSKAPSGAEPSLPEIDQRNHRSQNASSSIAVEKENTRTPRELSPLDVTASDSVKRGNSEFFQSGSQNKDAFRKSSSELSDENSSDDRPWSEATASSELGIDPGSIETSPDALLGTSGMSIQLKEEKSSKEERSPSEENRLSSPDQMVSALESLHGQRQFEEGSFTSQSTHESYSNTTIQGDEEESFWSILYDDDEGEGARNQKKEKPSLELQGWDLKLIKKGSLLSRKRKRGKQAHVELNRIPPKETLFERILRFIRQLLDLS